METPEKKTTLISSGDDRFSTGYITSGSIGFRKRGILDFAWILGVDNSLYTGNIYDVPLVQSFGLDSPFWKVPISGFQIITRSGTSEMKSQVIPTGTSAYGKIYSSSPNIVVPENIASAINLLLSGRYEKQTGLYVVPCSLYQSGPNLAFLFSNGVRAEIPPSQYIRQESSMCHSLITAGSDTKNILLGGPFFTSFYLVYQFSKRSLGVASSISGLGKVYTT